MNPPAILLNRVSAPAAREGGTTPSRGKHGDLWATPRVAVFRFADVKAGARGARLRDLVLTIVKTMEHSGAPMTYATFSCLSSAAKHSTDPPPCLAARVFLRSAAGGILYEWNVSMERAFVAADRVRTYSGTVLTPNLFDIVHSALLEIRMTCDAGPKAASEACES